VSTLGWPFPIRPDEWSDLAAFYADLGPEFGHISDIVQSVVASAASEQLAATTSMQDLLVVATPISEVPGDVVAVRTPGHGRVLIEHLAVTGNNDRIERASSDAVPLFWRFMIEKYGVRP
jgi:hypothetical protein